MYFDHYLGIDISKATLDAALIIKEGEVVGQTKVANNSHGFNDLASWIRKLKVKLSDVLYAQSTLAFTDMTCRSGWMICK